MFQKALPRVNADDMPMLFTKNFMRSWINHLSNSNRYLHKAARQVVRAEHRPYYMSARFITAVGNGRPECRKEQPRHRVFADPAANGSSREPSVRQAHKDEDC